MSLTHMVEILCREPAPSINKKVSRVEYNTFCKEYTWMALQGLRFGSEFCRRFMIADMFLLYSSDTEHCKKHISNCYVS